MLTERPDYLSHLLLSVSFSLSLSLLPQNEKKNRLRLEQNKTHEGFNHDNLFISIYPPPQLPLSLPPSDSYFTTPWSLQKNVVCN